MTGSEGRAPHSRISVLVRRDMRDMSIRERRGGSSAQALSLQHLELGPHSLQNREMQPAPPGPQARAHRDSPGRSSRTHALSAVLLRGGDPPGGRAGWREGGRQCPECPWMPLRSTQRPLRRGVRTVSAPDRSRRWGQAQLARPPPRLAPGGTVPPMSPPKEQAAGWVPSAAMLVPVLSGVRSGSLCKSPGGQWT